jgi:hypothetical protein
MISQAVFKMVLPMACAWAEEQEAVILRDGVALTASQIADAHHIGIAHPERVRLRVVEEIPLPLHPLLREAAEITGLISPRTAGLTLRYGIFIRSESWGERRLVLHELAHTAQYDSVVSRMQARRNFAIVLGPVGGATVLSFLPAPLKPGTIQPTAGSES